jgi:hypothetical protein
MYDLYYDIPGFIYVYRVSDGQVVESFMDHEESEALDLAISLTARGY